MVSWVRERLGRNREQRGLGAKPRQRFREVGRVDVRHVVDAKPFLPVGPQGLRDHHGPEIRTPDADVDDVGDALTRVPCPLAVAHGVGESAHPVEHAMDDRHDVFAVHQDRSITRVAQGDVQDRTAFGDIDSLTGKHLIDFLAQLRLVGEIEQ